MYLKGTFKTILCLVIISFAFTLTLAQKKQPKDSAIGHFNKAIKLADAGKTAEAIKAYEEAIKIRPDFAQAACVT